MYFDMIILFSFVKFIHSYIIIVYCCIRIKMYKSISTKRFSTFIKRTELFGFKLYNFHLKNIFQ